jgi:mRNA interferase YafQ
VDLPAADTPLSQRYFDHALGGNWTDHRNSHVRPNLVLTCCKPDDEWLKLVRLSSHSELGVRPAGTILRSPTVRP